MVESDVTLLNAGSSSISPPSSFEANESQSQAHHARLVWHEHALGDGHRNSGIHTLPRLLLLPVSAGQRSSTAPRKGILRPRELTTMTNTISIRIDPETKRRLTALAITSDRSVSCLVTEAISAYLEHEESQLSEIQTAMSALDAGQAVSHDRVANWLKSWGTIAETEAPH
jgi:predicted transcriptional regulator